MGSTYRGSKNDDRNFEDLGSVKKGAKRYKKQEKKGDPLAF